MYFPASDVLTGSRVVRSSRPVPVTITLPSGPSISTVGSTVRCEEAVTVHVIVCWSPAGTVGFAGEILTTGFGRAARRETHKCTLLDSLYLTSHSDSLIFIIRGIKDMVSSSDRCSACVCIIIPVKRTDSETVCVGTARSTGTSD